jgi:hypothetical protein
MAAPGAAAWGTSLVTGPLAGIAAPAAGAAVGFSQYTTQNLIRQAEEAQKAQEAGAAVQAPSLGKAVAAAIPQEALDVAGAKVFGPLMKAFPVLKNLTLPEGHGAKETADMLADAFEKGTLKTTRAGVVQGIGKGLAFEIPQEVAQQALERWNAGLSLTDEEARGEYLDAAKGALVLGGLAGAGEGFVETRGRAHRAQEASFAREQGQAEAAAAANPPAMEPAPTSGRPVNGGVEPSVPVASEWDTEGGVAGAPQGVDTATMAGASGAPTGAKLRENRSRGTLTPEAQEAAPEPYTVETAANEYIRRSMAQDVGPNPELEQFFANNAGALNAEFKKRQKEAAPVEAPAPVVSGAAPMDVALAEGNRRFNGDPDLAKVFADGALGVPINVGAVKNKKAGVDAYNAGTEFVIPETAAAPVVNTTPQETPVGADVSAAPAPVEAAPQANIDERQPRDIGVPLPMGRASVPEFVNSEPPAVETQAEPTREDAMAAIADAYDKNLISPLQRTGLENYDKYLVEPGSEGFTPATMLDRLNKMVDENKATDAKFRALLAGDVGANGKKLRLRGPKNEAWGDVEARAAAVSDAIDWEKYKREDAKQAAAEKAVVRQREEYLAEVAKTPPKAQADAGYIYHEGQIVPAEEAVVAKQKQVLDKDTSAKLDLIEKLNGKYAETEIVPPAVSGLGPLRRDVVVEKLYDQIKRNKQLRERAVRQNARWTALNPQEEAKPEAPKAKRGRPRKAPAVEAAPVAPKVEAKPKKPKLTEPTVVNGEAKPPITDEDGNRTPSLSNEQKEYGRRHAEDLGGSVVYQNGDIGLIRGYSQITGQPAYAPFIKNRRAALDVDTYTGSEFTDKQKEELKTAKQRLEKDAVTKHEAAPFVLYHDNLAVSQSISEQLTKVIGGWKNLLLPNIKLYVTTVEDARTNKDAFTGPERAVASSALDPNELGSARYIGDNTYYIAITPNTNTAQVLELLAHELGHLHQKEVFNRSSPETKAALKDEHMKWLDGQESKSARELVDSLRAYETGKVTTVVDMPAKELDAYWKSFSEWYADQVSRWAVSEEKPVSVVDKFFASVGKALRKFYQTVRGQGFLPNETFRKYLNESVKNIDLAPIEEPTGESLSARRTAAGGNATPTGVAGFPRNPNQSQGSMFGISANIQAKYGKELSALARKFNYKYQDAVDFNKWMTSALGVDRLPTDIDTAKKFASFESRKSGNLMLLDDRFVTPMVKKMESLKLDLQDVGMYLWARGAKDRNAMVDKVNANFTGNGSGLTNQEAADILEGFRRRGLTAKLGEVAKLHDKLVDHMLAKQVKAGLLSQDQADSIRKEQPFYTPLKGFATDGDMQIDGDEDPHKSYTPQGYERVRKGVKSSEYVRAEGRTSMPFNPLVYLIVDAQRITQRVEKNRVGQSFLNLLKTHPAETADIAKVYGTGHGAKMIAGVRDPVTGRQTLVPENLFSNASKYLVVKTDGVSSFIEFQDSDGGKAMQRAFENMTPVQLTGFLKGWTKVNNVVKKLMTSWSPPYLLGPAVFRDVSDAVASAYAAETDKASPGFGKKLGAKVAKYSVDPDVIAAVSNYSFGRQPKTATQARLNALLEDMIANGGSIGHSIIQSAEDTAQRAQKELERYAKASKGDPLANVDQGVRAVGHMLDSTARFMDLQARLATYIAAIDEGITEEDAAAMALNSSLDLTRRGELAHVMDNLFFFFSPTVESARKLGKMAFTTKNGIRIMQGAFAVGVLSALWNSGMSGDDDDDGRKNFLDVNPVTRQTRLVLFYGKGANDFVAIPMGFMLAYPKYIGERTAEAVMGMASGEDASASITSAVGDMFGAMGNTLSPVRVSEGQSQEMAASLAPGILKPFADLVVNKNYFGSPIYNKQFDTRRAASSMGRESTEEVWKWLATTLNTMSGGQDTVSGKVDFQPEAYRYVVESLLGGPYRTAKDVTKFATGESKDTGAAAIPLVRGFVGKGSEYVPMNNYYKNTAQMDAITFVRDHDPDNWDKQEKRDPLHTDPDVLDAYDAAHSVLDSLSTSRREELKGAETSKERQDIIEEYRTIQNEAYTEFNRVYNERKKALGK